MRIVLGVAGGIAAYKACHVVRDLRARGHEVRVVPTEAALAFVGAATWEALSGQPVQTTVFERVDEVEHVRIGQRADLVLVAPATADLLAKARAGLAGDLLTATLLTTTAPVVLVPAMHTEMWQNAATVDNVAVLRARGVHVMEPAVGRLTGPDSGPGRLPEPEEIVAYALEAAGASGADPYGEAPAGDMRGLTVLLSAGGTREPLDPVRYLGNRSSGKQGVALAAQAAARGARVRLVAANVGSEVLDDLPADVEVEHVETTAELQERMTAGQAEADLVVMTAAVADYRPAQTATHKMKKSGDAGLTIELVQNPDVLKGLVAARVPGQTIIGFAAETGSESATPEELAQAKIVRKGCDVLVLNDVSAGKTFGRDDNAVVVYGLDRSAGDGGSSEEGPVRELGRAAGSKTDVAAAVWDAVVGLRQT
ncbi:bifunctional phosphopantothenoylcysteine decarboxylase/phosphopantothenate--cysteine ligase CoaBC [Brevibacterium litoralis]|uniref:bifunctional phosphopantothenoylcysteine decarboxylase/phosphopantothenate--cysteine ligase CoaBC n=1 Tax=Brevibacterium litoralis TaxID=3138935 RepID=UPI0032EFA6DD